MPLEPTNVVSVVSNNLTGNISKGIQSVVSDVGLSTIGTTSQQNTQSIVNQAINAVQTAAGVGGSSIGNSQSARQQSHEAYASQNPFAVKLRAMSSGDLVTFKATPEINESRNVAYKTIDPLHMPGAVQVYQNSAPRTWSVSNIKLFSRNPTEAEENLATINMLRSWTASHFGTSHMLGAPPEVLMFSAYSDGANDLTNIRKIPVVIITMNLPWPTGIDYIISEKTKQPFPSVMTVDMTLVEAHSPKDFSEFNLEKFKNGKLEGF